LFPQSVRLAIARGRTGMGFVKLGGELSLPMPPAQDEKCPTDGPRCFPEHGQGRMDVALQSGAGIELWKGPGNAVRLEAVYSHGLLDQSEHVPFRGARVRSVSLGLALGARARSD
jgi:hypothetical protein